MRWVKFAVLGQFLVVSGLIIGLSYLLAVWVAPGISDFLQGTVDRIDHAIGYQGG